jgi:hypothetical protein
MEGLKTTPCWDVNQETGGDSKEPLKSSRLSFELKVAKGT